MRKKICLKQMMIVFLLITLIINISVPFAVNAQESEKKVIRVGWHEAPFFIKDQNGRQSGYSYEYQRKIAAYTGWDYEYVEGTWSDLLQKLKDGEIDLMSDVSYTEERTKDMLFTSIPMGTEAYYVFVSPDNKEITSDNITSLNGKRVGVAKNSIQKDIFIKWSEKHGIKTNITELSITGDDMLEKLGSEFDAVVTMDVYGTHETATPVCKIGSSDYYFAVNKSRPDILDELDSALNKIQDEDKYYDQMLYDKYLKNPENRRYFNTSEKEWLEKHGKIRIGYQDNYLAFCAKDTASGELTGALKDYLEYASGAFENVRLDFECICFPTAASAIEALKNGEIDCMFPANLTDYDAEMLDLVQTPQLMHSEMYAVVRASEQKEFLQKKNIVVAVNEGNTNYDIFLSDNYPGWARKYYKDTPTGLNAVENKEADCVIISNYRYSNISKQCERLHLSTVNTGVQMNFYIAQRKGDTQLYSILAKVTDVVPDSYIHTALTYYSTEDVKVSLDELLKENWVVVVASITLVFIIILTLLLHSIKAQKKVHEEEHLVKALNKKAFVDSLTSVRNKGAYSDYIQKLQDRLDQGEEFEFGVGIFDCNNLKIVNDEYGHDKGDIYLKTACQLICKVFDHSPVFRIGGDEFAVILQNSDFDNREQLVVQFENRRKEICDSAENKWEEVHIALGIAVYDPQNDSGISDTIRRADRMMYDNKRIIKSQS